MFSATSRWCDANSSIESDWPDFHRARNSSASSPTNSASALSVSSIMIGFRSTGRVSQTRRMLQDAFQPSKGSNVTLRGGTLGQAQPGGDGVVAQPLEVTQDE